MTSYFVIIVEFLSRLNASLGVDGDVFDTVNSDDLHSASHTESMGRRGGLRDAHAGTAAAGMCELALA